MRAFKESDHQDVHHAIETLIKKGFPYRFPKISISYFKLPSQGPHKAVHILWKQSQNEDSTPQQIKLVEELPNNSKSFYSRAIRKEIQHKLKRLGLVKAHQAVFVSSIVNKVIRTIYYYYFFMKRLIHANRTLKSTYMLNTNGYLYTFYVSSCFF